MSLRLVLSLGALLIQASCAELYTGRSYLSQMERDDSSFYNPREDFPVVAGDTGSDWMSDEDRRSRTPASENDRFEERTARILKSELRQLEGMQSQESLDQYNEFKPQLGTISQKIYFLNLPPHERADYLASRGLIKTAQKRYQTPHERMSPGRSDDVLLGMGKNEVLESLGKPMRVEVAGNPKNENERWLYRLNGASKYIYFESGRVEGWE